MLPVEGGTFFIWRISDTEWLMECSIRRQGNFHYCRRSNAGECAASMAEPAMLDEHANRMGVASPSLPSDIADLSSWLPVFDLPQQSAA